MEFRTQVRRLEAANDMLRIDERLSGANEPFAVAAEAARMNGPAVIFDDVPGEGRLVSGARGGPDRMTRRSTLPWSRCADALELPRTASYTSLLVAITDGKIASREVSEAALAAEETGPDVTALCLPAIGDAARPILTDGIASTTVDGESVWAPVRGAVRGRTQVRARVPMGFAAAANGRPVSLALGVPTTATIAAHLQWAGTQTWRHLSTPAVTTPVDSLPVSETDGGNVPASSEVVIDGRAAIADSAPTGVPAKWESTMPTRSLDVSIGTVATRPDPLIPFVPLGEPLADDLHVTSLVESARLHARVNGYWGVSPVEWVGLPVEAGLGICLVASEILYAGFEWQLANTLFAFASSFDKVVVLDADASFDDLARALDDMWVKAHPSHDWTFSEAAAPAATAPRYRQNGATGSRLYVNAAWDPRWDEEYIAPEVGFATVYPRETQRAVLERWTEFGFDAEPREGERER